jgi:hypothetical protein
MHIFDEQLVKIYRGSICKSLPKYYVNHCHSLVKDYICSASAKATADRRGKGKKLKKGEG